MHGRRWQDGFEVLLVIANGNAVFADGNSVLGPAAATATATTAAPSTAASVSRQLIAGLRTVTGVGFLVDEDLGFGKVAGCA